MQTLFRGEYGFKGLHGFPSRCRLWVSETDLHYFIIAKETDDNQGTSTTNAVEMLSDDLRSKLSPGKPIRWFEWLEHYSEPGLAFTEYDLKSRSWRASTAGDRAIIQTIIGSDAKVSGPQFV